jgi:hypothetical protein
VVDRHAGEAGEQHRRLLVLLGELHTALLVGQVEVAEGDAADRDRHAEEGPHHRVQGGETVGVWVLADVREAQRHRIADQLAQHSVAAGQRPDPPRLLLVDAEGDEPRQLGAVVGEDAEGGVAGVGEFAGGAEDAPQHGVRIELGEHVARQLHHRSGGGVHQPAGRSSRVSASRAAAIASAEPGSRCTTRFSSVPQRGQLQPSRLLPSSAM